MKRPTDFLVPLTERSSYDERAQGGALIVIERRKESSKVQKTVNRDRTEEK